LEEAKQDTRERFEMWLYLYFQKNYFFLYVLHRFDALISKIIFLKMKKNYFDAF